MQDSPLKIGFFSTGLQTYWVQFDNLHDNLLSYGGQIVELTLK